MCDDPHVVQDETTPINQHITEYCPIILLRVVDAFYCINKGKRWYPMLIVLVIRTLSSQIWGDNPYVLHDRPTQISGRITQYCRMIHLKAVDTFYNINKSKWWYLFMLLFVIRTLLEHIVGDDPYIVHRSTKTNQWMNHSILLHDPMQGCGYLL